MGFYILRTNYRDCYGFFRTDTEYFKDFNTVCNVMVRRLLDAIDDLGPEDSKDELAALYEFIHTIGPDLDNGHYNCPVGYQEVEIELARFGDE